MSTAPSKGMIFLETGHPILEDTLKEKLSKDAKQEPVNITCSDFDDVKYLMVVTSDKKNVIKFNVAIPYLKDIMGMGASRVLETTYGPYRSSSKENGYDVGFEINVDSLKESSAVVAKNFAEIKRNLLAGPFRTCFDALAAGKSSGVKPMVIPIRPKERIVLLPGSDRVYVYFSIYFADETDRAIAKVFLQEFSESQRKVPQAPNVSFSVECPSDLAKVREFRPSSDLVGYLQFQVFKSHIEGSAKMEKVITLFQGFRNYLHYHIKASKAHLHSRMRNRVELLLKVLKRADPKEEEAVGKKNFRTYQ